MAGPDFDRAFEPRHGEAVRLTDRITRVTAANSGPFTFHGTNTYLVGERDLAVIDPGPDDPAHVAAVLAAIGGRPVSAILVTHTHRDHSPATPAIQRATGAPTYGEGPHRAARPLAIGETNPLDASGDRDFVPDHALLSGDRVVGADWTLEAIATPGHTANHLAFALPEEASLFAGDHVMAWSTSIVAPPDGAMADYMASLDRLAARPETLYWPGHGGPVTKAQRFVKALKYHRLAREKAVLNRIAAGDETIGAMVRVIYAETDRALHGAAALSVLAHIEDLVARGLVAAEGPLGLAARYRLTRD